MKSESAFQSVQVRILASGPMLQLSVPAQVNLQENPLKSFLLSLFLSNLRRTIPQAQHDNYLFVTQNFELLREVRVCDGFRCDHLNQCV